MQYVMLFSFYFYRNIFDIKSYQIGSYPFAVLLIILLFK